MITERWYQLQAGGSVVFVMDASDAGAPCLSQAFDLLRRLARMLPNFSDHRLMFLGGSQSYSAGDLERKWPEWVRENAGRLSVLTPVYEALADTSETIVVLAAFRIFDLPDWRDTLQFQRTVFVRLGDASPGERVTLHAPDADTLRGSIQRSPTRIEIGGEGSIPTYWDNPAFVAQQSLRLEAERNGEHFGYQAVLAFAGRPGSMVMATATFDDGRTENLSLLEIGVPVPYQDWTALPAVEAKIVRECIERKEYVCPHCSGSHVAEELVCSSAGQAPQMPNVKVLTMRSIGDDGQQIELVHDGRPLKFDRSLENAIYSAHAELDAAAERELTEAMRTQLDLQPGDQIVISASEESLSGWCDDCAQILRKNLRDSKVVTTDDPDRVLHKLGQPVPQTLRPQVQTVVHESLNQGDARPIYENVKSVVKGFEALASLAARGVTGFVLVRVRGEQVEYRPHGSSALRLGGDRVALRSSEGTQIYWFDAARGAWLPEPGKFRQFHPVPGGDAHAIIV